MPPKKKLKHNISGLLNQKMTIPVIDTSHKDAIPSGCGSSTQPNRNTDHKNDEPDEVVLESPVTRTSQNQ